MTTAGAPPTIALCALLLLPLNISLLLRNERSASVKDLSSFDDEESFELLLLLLSVDVTRLLTLFSVVLNSLPPPPTLLPPPNEKCCCEISTDKGGTFELVEESVTVMLLTGVTVLLSPPLLLPADLETGGAGVSGESLTPGDDPPELCVCDEVAEAAAASVVGVEDSVEGDDELAWGPPGGPWF